VHQALFDLEQRFFFFVGLRQRACEVRRRAFGNHRPPKVVKRCREGDRGRNLRFLRDARSNACGALRVVVRHLEVFDGDVFVCGEGTEDFQCENESWRHAPLSAPMHLSSLEKPLIPVPFG
jgi:hypothetical protein